MCDVQRVRCRPLTPQVELHALLDHPRLTRTCSDFGHRVTSPHEAYALSEKAASLAGRAWGATAVSSILVAGLMTTALSTSFKWR